MFAAATVHEHRLYHISSTWTQALMSICSVGVCAIHVPIFGSIFDIDIGSDVYRYRCASISISSQTYLLQSVAAPALCDWGPRKGGQSPS
jgi:hypothetical protein